MRMKKIVIVLSLILVIGFILTACGGGNTAQMVPNNEDENENIQGEQPPVNQEVIEMDVNNVSPSTSHYGYNIFEPWKELVEEKTNGRVKVNLYHGGTLGKLGTAFEDISGGVYDVGFVATTYYYDSDWFPWSIGNLPFSIPSAELTSQILGPFVSKYWDEERLFEDLVYMGTTSTDPYVFFSSKPIEKADDLKNMKIRVPGKGGEVLIKNWDGVPVSLGVEEIYEALERGTIDLTIHSPISAVGQNYFEVAPYIVENMPVNVTPEVYLMNRDFFESLPEDLQKLFDEELNLALVDLATKSFMEELSKAWDKLADGVEGRGAIIQLPEEEMKKIQAAGKDQWDTWIVDANKKGYPGEQMMEEFKSLLRGNGVELPY